MFIIYRMKKSPLITCILSFTFAYAEVKNSYKSDESRTTVRSLTELKEKYTQAKDKLEKWYFQTDILRRYSSEQLNEKNLSEAKAFAIQNLSFAENYKDNWNYNDSRHYSNLVLGRISLRDRDLVKAKEYLNKACEGKVSSFGPNMTLAKELLEKSEKEAVLNYIYRCLVSWKPEGSFEQNVVRWKEEIKENKIPDFKANLKY